MSDRTGDRVPTPPPRRLAGHRARARRPVPEPAAGVPVAGPDEVAADVTGEVAPPAAAVPEPRPDAPVRGSDRPVRRLKAPDWRLVVATLVVLVLAATAVLLAVRTRGIEQREDARGAAQAAAEGAAATVLSYDYRRLDRDFAQAKRLLTGTFAGDYARTTQNVVRPSAEQVRAVVKAEVVASAVVRAPSADRVVVLLFVNQTTTSTRLDGPKVDLNRVRMTMLRVDGRWKVAGVDAL